MGGKDGMRLYFGKPVIYDDEKNPRKLGTQQREREEVFVFFFGGTSPRARDIFLLFLFFAGLLLPARTITCYLHKTEHTYSYVTCSAYP